MKAINSWYSPPADQALIPRRQTVAETVLSSCEDHMSEKETSLDAELDAVLLGMYIGGVRIFDR